MLPRGRTVAAGPAVAVLAALVVVAGFNLVRPNKIADLIADGYEPVALLDPWAIGSGDLRYVGQEYRPDAWIDYYLPARSPRAITGDADLVDLARRAPDEQILVLGSCEPNDPSYAFCDRASTAVTPPGATAGGPQIVRARELATKLGLAP